MHVLDAFQFPSVSGVHPGYCPTMIRPGINQLQNPRIPASFLYIDENARVSLSVDGGDGILARTLSAVRNKVASNRRENGFQALVYDDANQYTAAAE